MDARLIRQTKVLVAGGYIIEVVVWLVPKPVTGSLHPYKYRLFYGQAGKRIVGYDNERGKGDHKHVSGKELSYKFSGLDQLFTDFEADIKASGGHHAYSDS